MSNALDDKLAGALALAISQRPRANLQQIARSAGISKATLNRIAPTRKAVIAMLMERATTHLQEALAKADLATPPFAEALGRLTANVMQGRVFFMFWNTAQWVEIMDDQEHAPDELPIPSFYGEALEEFFLRGQKAGVFRIDLPAKWLVKAYDFLLYAAVESAHRGKLPLSAWNRWWIKLSCGGGGARVHPCWCSLGRSGSQGRDRMNRDLTQFSPEQTIQEQTLDRSAMERLGTNTSAKWLLEDCELKGDFSRLDLSGFVFRRCMLVETSWPAANLEDTQWLQCRAGLASFERAKLTDSSFEGCDLNNTRWRHAKLASAAFRGCKLTGANFEGWQRSGWTFPKASWSALRCRACLFASSAWRNWISQTRICPGATSGKRSSWAAACATRTFRRPTSAAPTCAAPILAA